MAAGCVMRRRPYGRVRSGVAVRVRCRVLLRLARCRRWCRSAGRSRVVRGIATGRLGRLCSVTMRGLRHAGWRATLASVVFGAHLPQYSCSAALSRLRQRRQRGRILLAREFRRVMAAPSVRPLPDCQTVLVCGRRLPAVLLASSAGVAAACGACRARTSIGLAGRRRPASWRTS